MSKDRPAHDTRKTARELHRRRCSAQCLAIDGPCPRDVRCVLPDGHDPQHRDPDGFHFPQWSADEWARRYGGPA